MAFSARTLKDFVVITSFIALITPKMDIIVVLVYELEAEALVPPFGEDIK